ncbi:hypothetical protein FS749_004837 [Ceratobasidium sp. UAMH 11750]|nr:hypothetical protein FS749_004837 [Ceratobasidium sp. UAMH 11750]
MPTDITEYLVPDWSYIQLPPMSPTLVATPLDFQDQSALSRTLRVPELCRIICDLLNKKHYVKLLYLSRSIYDCILPIVWEDVDLRTILLLIPGATVTRGEPVWGSEPDYVFTFHEAINPYWFNVHAPLLKTVTTTGSYIIHFPSQWPKPEMLMESNSLLPNLRHIIVNTFGSAKPEHIK